MRELFIPVFTLSLRGAAGGLDRYDAADGDCDGGRLEAEDDGLVCGLSVDQVAVPPVHADVVAGAVVVVVLGVGRARVDGGGTIGYRWQN